MELNTYDMLGRPEDIEPVSGVIRTYSQFKRDLKSPDFLIVVGGDGTLVWREYRERVYNSRILRVHQRKESRKTQGYTADITNLDKLRTALDDITNGDYFLQEEKLIDLFVNDEKRDTAIYDIAIIHKNPFYTLLFDAVVDRYKIKIDEALPSPKCDKFLVSTPHASAAWSFSVGGPINLDADSMLINIVGSPIRPDCFTANMEYPLYVKVYCDVFIGVDAPSGNIHEAKDGAEILIKESDKRISFIRTTNTLESLLEKTYRRIEHSQKPVKQSG